MHRYTFTFAALSLILSVSFEIACGLPVCANSPIEVGSPLFAGGQKSDAAAIMQARALARQFKYKEASDLLEQAIKPDHKSYQIEMSLGRLMLKQGRFQKALEHFGDATSLNPGNNDARFEMASVYETMGRFNDANMVLNQIIKRYPFSRDSFRADRFKRKIISYRENGDPYAASYVEDQEFTEKFLRSDFPISVAVWVDPALKKFKTQFEQSVNDSFAKWRNASGGYLRYRIVPNQKDARIVCKMLTSKREGADDSVLGLTSRDPSFSEPDTLKFSRVEVFFDPDRDPREIDAVTLHEVGHALGLSHSANTRDIMFPTANQTYISVLSRRDINSIRQLYGIKPGDELVVPVNGGR